MTNLVLLVGGTAALFYIIPKLVRFFLEVRAELWVANEEEQSQPKLQQFVCKTFGGPCDGHIHQVEMPDRPHWYVSPYLPTDEEGNPDERNRVGFLAGTHYFKPNLAYYQQVTDEDYFYVRDITEQEFETLAHFGKLPDPEGNEDE